MTILKKKYRNPFFYRSFITPIGSHSEFSLFFIPPPFVFIQPVFLARTSFQFLFRVDFFSLYLFDFFSISLSPLPLGDCAFGVTTRSDEFSTGITGLQFSGGHFRDGRAVFLNSVFDSCDSYILYIYALARGCYFFHHFLYEHRPSYTRDFSSFAHF